MKSVYIHIPFCSNIIPNFRFFCYNYFGDYMTLRNYYKEVSLIKISIVNFFSGLITGFPVFIAVIYFFGNSKLTGSIIGLLSLTAIIIFNYLLNKYTKNRNSKSNEYLTMFASFIFLFLGMLVSTNILSMFMTITL